MTDDCVTTTIEEVKMITETTLQDLLMKWNSMYVVTDEIKMQRLSQFLCHLKDFYHDMLICEEKRKNYYMAEAEKKLKECRDLEKALNVTINCDIDCSFNPLTEVIKHLDNTLKSFEKVKQERMDKLNALRAQESSLCKTLGFKELHIANTIPSEEDIHRLEEQICLYEEEKFRRLEQFLNYREHIVEYIQKLERSTLLDFEKTLMESDSTIYLTSEDLERVREIEESYKKEFNAAKVKVEYMLDQLKRLWNRLDIPEDYQIDFLEKHNGVGRKTMDKIQDEIHRCEKLRLELIVPLIEKTKCQISDVCDKLCYTKDQRPKNILDNNHSEDLLSYLEHELVRLEIIYNKNSDILEVAKKQRDMCERKREMEAAAKDKARLFNNRGGQLLREEKERKTIEQALPKLNKKLEDMLIEYEERTGAPFLYYGQNLLHILRDDIEQACINKQNKISKKNEPKITDSATKLREKRKVNCLTPKSENGKRLKLAGSMLSLASSSSKNSNKSVDGRSGSRSRIALFKDQDTSVASSYSLFQEEIEEKKRSTTMCNPERQPLKDLNSPVISFLSSPSKENCSRFTFRPRANQFNATAKSASCTPASKKQTPRLTTTTPGNAKNTFATPKTMLKSVNRLATPKQYLTNRTCTPGANNISKGKYFETPKSTSRSAQKTLSTIKPSKFNFDF